MAIEQYMKQYEITLNEQQKQAVKTTNGKILLLAVPGSGKTTVIVARIGYLIHHEKINPKNILTLTYSVAAARDMKQRYEKVFGIEESKKVQFRTIHSFCVAVIKKYEIERKTKAFSLLQNTNELLSQIYCQVMHEFSNDGIIKEIMTKITYCKNNMFSEEEIKNIKIENVDFLKIYKIYENYKIQNRKMDYDDQLKYAYQILKTFPDILKYFKQTYSYINIDEAQDTSKIQHEIIKLLANDNLFMVGDEDQSIYKFRAAYPKALLDFNKTYKNSKLLFMETNYRSTKEIVKTANQFIKQNQDRKEKNMISVRENGKAIKQVCLKNIQEQYEYILEKIQTEKEIAILYRNNESAIPLIDLFNNKNIKFKIKEGETTFFSHKVIRDIIKILEFSFQLSNIELFKDIYFKINCGISKKMIQEIEEEQKDPNINVFDLLLTLCDVPTWQRRKWIDTKLELKELNKKNSYDAIRTIMKQIGYEEFLKSRSSENDEKVAYSQKINILLAIAKQHPNIKEFLLALENLEEMIKQGTNKENNKEGIYLSTIHASKGLEYENVILIDLINGILPGTSKPVQGDSKEIIEEYEEEVRLFYVGMTRAKTQLEMITYKRNYYGEVEKSEFLKDIFETIQNNSFKTGQTVIHKKFGKCKIIKIEEKFITIKNRFGLTKKLDTKICNEKGLLQIYNK